MTYREKATGERVYAAPIDYCMTIHYDSHDDEICPDWIVGHSDRQPCFLSDVEFRREYEAVED